MGPGTSLQSCHSWEGQPLSQGTQAHTLEQWPGEGQGAELYPGSAVWVPKIYPVSYPGKGLDLPDSLLFPAAFPICHTVLLCPLPTVGPSFPHSSSWQTGGHRIGVYASLKRLTL
jgi:hypothetical protein